MGISTSDGQYFEDEFDHLASKESDKPVTSGTSDSQLSSEMTHQPDQPNPAAPYIQGLKDFSTGGISKVLGDNQPDWSKKLGETLASPEANTAIGMFGGRMSPAAVGLAKALETAGAPETAIKEWTGLERGADQMWRREFSDSESKLDTSKLYPSVSDTHGGVVERGPLGDILKHDELYKAYPEAKDIGITVDPRLKSLGLYNNQSKQITVRGGMEPDLTKSTLLHEVQHWIQDKEGFALSDPTAFSPKFIDQVKGAYLRDKMEHSGALDMIFEEYENGSKDKARQMAEFALKEANFHAYKSQVSEQEAHNVSRRMNLTAKEISKTPGSWTEDIPRDRQIMLNR